MAIFLSRPFTLPNNSIPSRLIVSGKRAIMAQIKLKDSIELTEKEEKIFGKLMNVVNHFNLKTQLRVAGGWVRDKLLGKESNDIDIALDDMMGTQFCEKVNEYFSHTGEETRNFGVIERNPEQSKHLETATMQILDMWIDFVNLRSERYTEDSRIPIAEFGTAEEDAYRRDLTINSLFYNITTASVEDLTKRGLADLKNGKIVTPLPPKATFLDDPLRVLRAIRFGARFGFVLDEELKLAASDSEVKAALASKISRERIGHEIDLMIAGKRPVEAVSHLCDLGLFWTVFGIPEGAKPMTEEGCDRNCLSYLKGAWDLLDIGQLAFTDDQRRLFLYASLFIPLMKSHIIDSKKKEVPLVNHIFRVSLKLKTSDAETAVILHKKAENFAVYSSGETFLKDDYFLSLSPCSQKRVTAGILLGEIKELWRVALLLSVMLPKNGSANFEDFFDDHNSNQKVKFYKEVEESIMSMGLEDIWMKKTPIDGRGIMSILAQNKGGREIGLWKDRVRMWQLANPSGTADECLDWLGEAYRKRPKHDVPQHQT